MLAAVMAIIGMIIGLVITEAFILAGVLIFITMLGIAIWGATKRK